MAIFNSYVSLPEGNPIAKSTILDYPRYNHPSFLGLAIIQHQ